jgi:hypothetical protein
MSESRPRITIPASGLEPSSPAPDPFGQRPADDRQIARARLQSRAVLGLGLAAITFGVALLAAGSGATLDLAAVALIVLGLPAAVLGNDRLGRVAAAGRGGPYAATDAGFGWGWGGAGWSGSDCGDGGGGFFGGGDSGGGGGGGDGGGGGC